MRTFPSIRIEGGLFGPDLIEALTAADLPGQKPQDFGLPPRRNLTDEIAAALSDARALWGVFQNRLARLPESDLATSLTRDAWAIPFLGLLGYELRYNPRAYDVDGLTFAISHRAGEAETAPPVHIVGVRQELGRLAPSGRPRLSPHALMQEYLNRSEALWGLVTNGRTLRLLRDSTFVRRQAYVEFDLESIFAEERFADFVILYRLLHRTRLPREAGEARECLLEKYYSLSVEQGGRVREHLREGVEECLKRLANGFLRHPQSAALRDWVRQEGAPLFYRELLRLVYRFLFLLVSEERGLISDDPLYLEHYGVTRLRRWVDERAAYTQDDDLWQSLRVLWLTLTDERLGGFLRLPPLNGDLFSPLHLDEATLTNCDLLEAFWYLAYYQESRATARRVNYAALDTEELGSVYESLLDYHPDVTFDSAGRPSFDLVSGSERKSTGSYYTPPPLVNELIKSALEPVMRERLEGKSGAERARALLSIRVLDPACGSGHFLLAAARTLGKELARIQSGEDEPAPERIRQAIREVVAHCIYGVDKNPLAIELCRVALWIESHAGGKPLTFLDHHIRCGDSLLGVLDLSALQDGLPDEAFDPLEGDDRKMASSLKRQNRREREGQMGLFGWNLETTLTHLADANRQLDAIPDDTPELVRHKMQLYGRRFADPDWRRQKEACDLWTAAFFQSLAPLSQELGEGGGGQGVGGEGAITTDTVRGRLRNGSVSPQALAQAAVLAEQGRFFHWALEFPEVFSPPRAEGSGFDVVLGNPPWERIKLQEQEFFATREPRIAAAPNAAARKRLIAELPKTNPALWAEYRRALRLAESASRFLRGSGHYPLTGRGDINTYSVFAERMRALLKPGGRAGIILPTGIATDDTNKHFFGDLVDKREVFSLTGFENEAFIFPDVHHAFKFCALTIGGTESKCDKPDYVFFCRHFSDVHEETRHFTLSREDIARINPNTRTCPVFRTRQDADLTRAIYARVPVLVNEATDENPWGVRFLRMLDMSNDSHLFRTREQLEAEGFRLVGNRFVRSAPEAIPDRWRIPDALRRKMVKVARELRRNPTPSEAILWEALRGKKLDGVKFRRQQPIGPFVVDFYASEHRLIVEVDGGVHASQLALDRQRQSLLESLGLRFARIPAELVERDLPRALEMIRKALSPTPGPSPTRGEGSASTRGSTPPSPPVGEGGRGGEGIYLPLYEAKMIWHYDHRFGSYAGRGDERGFVALPEVTDGEHQDSTHLAQPFYWVLADEVESRLSGWPRGWLLGFRDVTSAVVQRTAIFSLLPRVGVGHTMPVLLAENAISPQICLLLANFNSLVFDWPLRQKIGGMHLTFFILRQLPVLPPSAYTLQAPSTGSGQALRFIVPRVLELTYTAWDIKPFADDVWREADAGLRAALEAQWQANVAATGGHVGAQPPAWAESAPDGFPHPPFKWDEGRRAVLRAELDALYARLYGLTRKQLRYILDPADLTPRELQDILDPWEEVSNPLDPQGYAERCAKSDFPGETFRVLKEKELREYGEYRTRRLVLEAWEK